MTTISTLDDLLDTLTSCPACLAGADPLDEDAPAHTCGDIDWTDLPTFGGVEPASTDGVWSWDETHLLVGECASELRIIPRWYGLRDRDITALRDEAAEAGDRGQVAVCDRALDGDADARRECARVIDEARDGR